MKTTPHVTSQPLPATTNSPPFTIDLQMHTNASDGKYSPKEVVTLAKKKGMKMIAITDHDTISGIAEALEQSKKTGVEVIPGVELSCHEPFYKHTIDILGLFIDPSSKALGIFMEANRHNRIVEKEEILRKLSELGYHITFDELHKESGESLGRPVIARMLVKKYPEQLTTVNDVFEKLIGDGKPAFVKREKTTMKEAIKIIKASGGVSILAHPARYGNDHETIIEHYVTDGGTGIETNYPNDKILGLTKERSEEFNNHIRQLAKQHDLLHSGGSDFHDEERSHIGDGGVTEEEFKLLKNRAGEKKK